MSYILDALRRADAERDRGGVPGLHARPLSAEPVAADAGGSTRRLPWPAMAIGAVVTAGVVAALVWWVRPAAAPAPAAAAVIAAAPHSPLALPPAAMPLPAPAPAVLPPPAAAEAPAVPPKPRTEKAARVADKPVEKPPTPKLPASPKEPAGPPATPLSQLPPDAKSQMPPISIGGSIYSSQAGSRFVIINGQVVREGEPAATGMVLERIGAKSAILRWREWRIEVPL